MDQGHECPIQLVLQREFPWHTKAPTWLDLEYGLANYHRLAGQLAP